MRVSAKGSIFFIGLFILFCQNSLAKTPDGLKGITVRGQIALVKPIYNELSEVPAGYDHDYLKSFFEKNNISATEQVNYVRIYTGEATRTEFKIEFRGSRLDKINPFRKGLHARLKYEDNYYYLPLRILDQNDVYIFSFYMPEKKYRKKRFNNPGSDYLWFKLVLNKENFNKNKIIKATNPDGLYKPFDSFVVRKGAANKLRAITMHINGDRGSSFGIWRKLIVGEISAKPSKK